jgi:hypothetical protein
VVRYRDGVVHDGYLPGISEAMIPPDKALGKLHETDVVLPLTPGRVSMIDIAGD